MKITKYITFMFAMILLTNCGGSGNSDNEQEIDQEKPTINILSPDVNTNASAGNILQVNINLADNDNLSDYLLTVNQSGTKSIKTVETFSFNSKMDLDADDNALPEITGKKSLTLNFGIAIAENAQEGNYILFISVTDKVGNEDEQQISFSISRK